MATRKTTSKNTVSNLLESIPRSNVMDFVKNKGSTEFNKRIRDALTSHYVEMDFTIPALKSAKWNPIEVKYLHQAALQVLPRKFIEGSTIYDPKYPEKLFIKSTGGFEAEKVFGVQQEIYKEILEVASNLLVAENPTAANLKDSAYKDAWRAAVSLKDEDIDKIFSDPKQAAKQQKIIDLVYTNILGIKEGRKLPKGFSRPVWTVHAGHIEGHENFRLAAAARVFSLQYKLGNAPLPNSILEEVRARIGIDEDTFTKIGNYTLTRLKSEATGTLNAKIPDELKITQKCTIEVETNNISRKNELSLANALGKDLIDILNKYYSQEAIQQQITASGLSPSMLQRIQAFLISALTGGSAKIPRHDLFSNKSSKKYKPYILKVKSPNIAEKNTVSVRNRVSITQKLIDKIQKVLNAPTQVNDLYRLQGLINSILAKKIEEEMESSSAAPSLAYLRYQTGRFAKSAQLLTLNRTQAGILYGTYSYQHKPYDVFLDGRLATPGRNPKRYVEGAIRKAATEQLKGRFPGIQLEMK